MYMLSLRYAVKADRYDDIQPKEDVFAPPVEEKKKPRGEVVKYTIDFLHSLSEVRDNEQLAALCLCAC